MKTNPDLQNYNSLGDKEYRFDCYLDNDFSDLKPITQAYCIAYNENNEILLVQQNHEYWNLPGGTIDSGEDPRGAIARELKEEANTLIYTEKLRPFFYQEVFREENGKWVFVTNQVRFIAPIKKKGKFIHDPGGQVTANKLVPVSRLHEHLKWGEVSNWMQQEVEKLINDRDS